MKKFLSLLLALTMLLTLCGAASAEAGVFTGVGDSEIGGKGAIEVAVTVDENGAVTAIEVTKNGDTAGISDPAVAQIPRLIVEQQTANVDAVAGATKTSDAIMAAVLAAVTKAGLDTVSSKRRRTSPSRRKSWSSAAAALVWRRLCRRISSAPRCWCWKRWARSAAIPSSLAAR